ncbi:hypothetical protein [Halomonas sp. WWR20]
MAPSIGYIDFSTYNPDPDDCTVQFRQALHDAQNAGKGLNLGSGVYTLASDSIMSIAGKDVVIVGTPGLCVVQCSNNSAKSSGGDQGLSAKTPFMLMMQEDDYSSLDLTLYISGIHFKNLDTSQPTRCLHGYGCMRQCVVSYCTFEGFTAAGAFGRSITTEGVHPGSDAQTSIAAAILYGNRVESDTRTTGQCPKAFHIHHATSSLVQGNSLLGNGEGYVYRVNGGGYDVIPVPGRGSCNARFTGNYVKTQQAGREYCQIAKTTNIVIADNTADATEGDRPHNFFDLFNCMNVSYTGNTVYGGGLLFHGHGDLNNGNYPGNLIGPHSLTITGNTMVNPTHYAVINLGGDGNVDGNRAFHAATISGNTVYTTDDYNDEQGCDFIYCFLCNDITLTNNTICGIKGFLRTFWSKSLLVDGNIIRDVPLLIRNTDGGTFEGEIHVGTNLLQGTSGDQSKLSGSLTTQMAGGDSAERLEAKTGYMAAPSVTLDANLSGELSGYMVTVGLASYPGSQKQAVYFVTRSADTDYIIPMTAAIADVSVIINDGNDIAVSYTGSGNRTLKASATRMM